MSILEAIILGIIQGLTEFLPVSSSGHLELGKALLRVEIKEDLLFSIFVHFATTLSTLVVFRKDIALIIQDLLKFQWNENTQFAFKILFSMLPVGLVGLLFKNQIESFFDGNIFLVGLMLCLTGGLLLFTHFASQVAHEGKVSFGKALLIGIAQAIAILPGISRSGATIATALLLKINRSEAARFSFLMVLAPIIGATLLEIKDYQEADSQDLSAAALTAGFLAAFATGTFACQLMLRLVREGKLLYFALYCLIAGGVALLFSWN